MVTLEQIALSWFLNAVWELPVCFICCWLLVRFVPRLAACTCYVLWLLAFGLGFLAPFGTLLGLLGDAKTIGSGFAAALPTTVNDSGAPHLLLLIFAAPASYHALLLLRGGIAASRLARRAVPVELRILESVLPRDLVVNIKRCRARIFSTGSATPACGPFTFGVRRPFIVIPATLFAAPKRQMLVSVVAHELAHVQRRDMLLHLLSEIMLVPLAFHPFAYWLRSRLAEAREMACDARVSGPILSATDYARCLLDVAATLNGTASSLNALGISESATLEHRIQSLILLSSSPERKLGVWNKSCLILAASVVFGVLFSAGRTTFLWMSAVPEPRSQREMLQVPPPPPPPPNRR